jgi:hypothetical protein
LPSIKPGHDQRNHHAHLLMSACSVRVEAGVLVLGKKVEALDPIAGARRGGEPVAEVERAIWAAMCNTALAAAGSAVTYDHRSYERQGVDLIPQIHLGPAAHDNLLLAGAGADVVLLDRTKRHLEIDARRAHLSDAQHWEGEVARLQATEVTEISPPASRPDEPVQGPSAVVVPIRPEAPEPPPAPDVATVVAQIERLWRAYSRSDNTHDDGRDDWPPLRLLDRNSWKPDAPAFRALLEDPATRREWSAEIEQREPEIAAAEYERQREQRAIRRVAARAYLVPVPGSEPISGMSIPAVEAVVKDFLQQHRGPPFRVIVIVSEGSDDIPAAEFTTRNTLFLAADLLTSPAHVVEAMSRALQAKYGLPGLKHEASASLEAPGDVAGDALLAAAAREQEAGALDSPARAPEGENRELRREVARAYLENAGASRVPAESEALWASAAAREREAAEAEAAAVELAEAERLLQAGELRLAENKRQQQSVAEAIVAEFLESYTAGVPLVIEVVSNPDPAAPVAEYDGSTLFVAVEHIASRTEALKGIDAAIRRRHGLSLLRPEDKASILRAVVAAASSGLQDIWATVTDRYPTMPLAARAERVFAAAARAVKTAGKTWDAICLRLAGALRAVGLLRGSVKLPEMRQIARELCEAMPVEAAAARLPPDARVPELREPAHQAALVSPVAGAPVKAPAAPAGALREVMALVARLDIVLAGDERRQEWATLALLDAQPRHFDTTRLEYLRQVLAGDPQQLGSVVAELSDRIAELERYEEEAEFDGGQDEDQAPR